MWSYYIIFEYNQLILLKLKTIFFSGYIMAGLWGAKNSADRDKIFDLGSTLFHSKPRKYWDFDQALLRRIVWPEAVRSVLQHDAYSCKYNKFNQFHPVMPFPSRREGAKCQYEQHFTCTIF